MKTIKELHKDDKPREKLVKKGVASLKNDELLSVLIGSDEKDWLEKMEYMKTNPIKHKLVENLKDWKHSSFNP
ncbi:MAG TPA: hypothetical protein EYG94_09595 [Campylobacterales bacterium]|nr:hypothetical protein [Campylobacterales bacterium]